MVKLYFDYRDIFRSARIAFSLQRMWIQLVGMAFGLAAYLVVTYGAFLSAGNSLKDVWNMYGLLPCFFGSGETFPWYSWIVFGIGAVIFLCVFLITNTAVARASYMQMKGNNFYTWREAFRFAIRKAGSVILTPVSLAIMIGFIVLGALVVGLLGKIPYVGELGVSLFTLFWFLTTIFLFFLTIVAGVSFLLVPSIIATTDEDAFEAVFQTFSTTWSQPWRFIFYEALTMAVSVVALGIFAFFAKEGILIANRLLGVFMGSDYINLANNGQALVQSWTLLSQNVIESLFSKAAPAIYFSKEFIYITDLPITVKISGYFYALSLLFLGGWVLSYGLSTFSVGNTLLYITLRKKKDDENLLERKDKEEEEEEEEKSEEGEDVKEDKIEEAEDNAEKDDEEEK